MRTKQRGRGKTHRVQANIGNAVPVDGRTNAESFIGAWKEAEALFHNREHLAYYVTLDATDTLELLHIAADVERGVEKPFQDRLRQRTARNLSPFGSQIVLTFGGGDSAELKDVVIERFLENLYLVMNLSLPGSCNLHRASFHGRRTAQITQKWSRAEHLVWLDLAAEVLEFAYQSALEQRWPRFERVELAGTWEWLQRTGALDLDVAREPWQRALFTLLRIGRPQSHDPDVIQLCVQAIEALLGQGAPTGVVKRRVESVLGAPSTHKNWYSALHRTRSLLAHGAAPLMRPGRWLSEDEPSGEVTKYLNQIEQACAVLLALIQALVLKNARTFEISEVVALC